MQDYTEEVNFPNGFSIIVYKRDDGPKGKENYIVTDVCDGYDELVDTMRFPDTWWSEVVKISRSCKFESCIEVLSALEEALEK